MAKIPGIVFIIIGAVVAITSIIVRSIFFFIYVGAGFILWGGGKILYSRLAEEEKPKKDMARQHVHHKAPNHSCPYCNRLTRPHDNFCSNCGALLKHQRGHENLNQGSHNQHNYGYNNQIRRVP